MSIARASSTASGPTAASTCPETLMPALEELEAAWIEARARPRLRGGARRPAAPTTPGGRRRCTCAERLSEVGGPRDLAQARGPAAHRRAQDQQRARPGAARQAHGQAADHRRDRRRPARRRHRDGVRAARPRVRRLHGRRGHAPPAAQRPAHASCSAPRSRRVEAGTRTLKEATSEAIRDWVTNVGDHALRDRLGGRPGAVPGDRARPAARDRRRGARAAARARGPPARRAWSRASAAAPTRSACSRRSSTTRASS